MARTRTKLVNGLPAVSGTVFATYSNGNIISYNTSSLPSSYTTETCVDETHKGPPYKEGGPLLITKHRETCSTFTWPYTRNTYYTSSHGTVRLGGIPQTGITSSLPLLSSFSTNDLTVLGTEGWTRYKPLKPNMDLNQFIGELRDTRRLIMSTKDLLEDLWRLGSNRNILKALASDHLSIQFGWKPIVNDVKSMLKAYDFTEKRVEFIKNNSGKTHKRGGPLIELEETSVSANKNVYVHEYPSLPGSIMRFPQTNLAETYRTEREAWFEGKFGFHIPISDMPEWEARKYLYSQGLGLDLSAIALLRTVYQLTPWSWLADWFGTQGDILDNLVSIHSQGVFAEYAYVMARDKYEFQQEQSIYIRDYSTGWFAHRGRPVYLKSVEFKQRMEASPFGFGLKLPDFTNWQIGILLALGISLY